jgi:hypothetical protein
VPPLDVQYASTQPGAPVILWEANGGANQQWTFAPTGGYQTYEIINVNSGQCLTAYPAAGDQVYQWPCYEDPEQQWVTALQPDGGIQAYTIQNVKSGLYLDVTNNSSWSDSSSGIPIDTWPYNGQNNQYFAGV